MNHLIDFFPRLINMSAVASIVILFVLAARLILKRAPKIFSYALWAIVLIRLLVPVTFPAQSALSRLRRPQTARKSMLHSLLWILKLRETDRRTV